jgi:hypothetical protein
LQIQGFDISTDPNYPPCQPVTVPAGGKYVVADVDVQPSGGDWVATPLSAGDDIEIRFHADGSSTLQGQTAVGNIIRSVLDNGTVPYVQPHNVRASFSGASDNQAADLTASVNSFGYVNGRISGKITFIDTISGTTGNCAAVTFSLQAYPR